MGEVIISGGEGVKWVLDSATNDKVLQLSSGENAQVKTLQTAESGANIDYQVPASRKFVALQMTIVSSWTTQSATRFFDSASTDSATGIQIYPAEQTINTVANQNAIMVLPCYFEIPATHYLNVDNILGFTNAICLGVETDA